MKETVIKVGPNYELKDILQHVLNGSDLSWKILWLQIIGVPGTIDVLRLEESINGSEEGLSIDWTKLIHLSNSIQETIELLIIADADSNKLKRYVDDDELRRECMLCIEMVDSSYWLLNDNSGVHLSPL
jgi:hypothetical protein